MTDGPLVVRAAVPGPDLGQIAGIDISYETDRVYRVRADGLGFRLAEERVDPPVTNSSPRPSLTLSDGLLVACADDEVIGYGELRFEVWNDRARAEHLYVARPFRGRGAGRALMDALDEHARRATSARCLWLETQNVNYPAVQFYRRMGFRLCGLDDTLYAPGPDAGPGEVALYFTRNLVEPGPPE